MCVQPWRVKAKNSPFLNGSKELVIPCGKCPECIKKRQREWYVRFMLEDKYYRLNYDNRRTYFITLTYNNDNYPDCRETALLNWQACLKSLSRHLGTRPRFFLTSENGTKLGRLHFHLLLFGVPLVDVDIFRQTILEKAWPHGFNHAELANGKLFSYIAKYVTKDIEAFHTNDWKTIQTWSKRPCLGIRGLSPQMQKYFSDNLVTSWVDTGIHYGLTRTLVKKVLNENQRKILLDEYERNMPKEYDSTDKDMKFRNHECWSAYARKCRDYRKKKQSNIIALEHGSELLKGKGKI